MKNETSSGELGHLNHTNFFLSVAVADIDISFLVEGTFEYSETAFEKPDRNFNRDPGPGVKVIILFSFRGMLSEISYGTMQNMNSWYPDRQ